MITYNPANKEIRIEDEPLVSFEDILDALNPSVIRRDGDSYTIDADIRLRNSALVDKSVSVTVLGKQFQIEEGSYFKLGEKASNGRTHSGCFFSMPNVDIRYGFGEDTLINDATGSGDLYLYDSKINVWGFWGFFRGPDQIVEVIDCIVHGFGRVEGTTSIIRNVQFDESHPRYGVLSLKGTLAEYRNVSSAYSPDCSYYFNPMLADDMRVIGGRFENYQQLVYSEPSPLSDKTVTFVDADIRGNLEFNRGDNTHLKVVRTFKPIFVNNGYEPYANEPVAITNDSTQEVVFEGTTDENGQILTELCVYEVAYNQDYPPVTEVFAIEIQEQTIFYIHDNPFVDQPFYVNEPVTVDDGNGNNGNNGNGNNGNNGQGWGVGGTPNDNGNNGNGNGNTEDPGDGSTGDTTVPDLGDYNDLTPVVSLDPDARAVVYVCTNNERDNRVQRQLVLDSVPDDIKAGIPVFVDIARDAYNVRIAYENMIMHCLSGEIKQIWMYEPETFGPTRKGIACKILDYIGVQVIFIRDM